MQFELEPPKVLVNYFYFEKKHVSYNLYL